MNDMKDVDCSSCGSAWGGAVKCSSCNRNKYSPDSDNCTQIIGW